METAEERTQGDPSAMQVLCGDRYLYECLNGELDIRTVDKLNE